MFCFLSLTIEPCANGSELCLIQCMGHLNTKIPQELNLLLCILPPFWLTVRFVSLLENNSVFSHLEYNLKIFNIQSGQYALTRNLVWCVYKICLTTAKQTALHEIETTSINQSQWMKEWVEKTIKFPFLVHCSERDQNDGPQPVVSGWYRASQFFSPKL